MTVSLPHLLRTRAEHREHSTPAPGLERRRWEVRGTVQAVGYRPFVLRLASTFGLAGHVRNTGGTVLIDADGTTAALDAFEARLRAEAPPLAVVTALVQLPPRPGASFCGFVVEESLASAMADPAHRDLPPDAGICDACVAELFDRSNRRFRYPLISCVDCGPRASIISALPYDRHETSMAGFVPCPSCAVEYEDPDDRRFRAEPIACPMCGPRLSWWAGEVLADGDDAVTAAGACIASGGIAAIKGPGGYQLVCDATDPAAVELLRKRKHSPDKPFAVMVADLHAAARCSRLSAEERELLAGPARPIVLAGPHAAASLPPIAQSVQAGSADLGVILPSTGLHHLLLRAVGRPLALTSANTSGEPTIIDDGEARTRLAAIADGICAHNRRILVRLDDSVVTVTGERQAVTRRARGYAPAPHTLPVGTPKALLAVGAQSDHTFALARNKTALISTHIGDLTSDAALAAAGANLERLGRLHVIEPEYVVHDLYDGYQSQRFVQRFPENRRIAVQHHHAHIASCAAEHGLTGDVIGVAYDGPALGDDGTLWGGEVMIANLTGYTRLARFDHAPLVVGVEHPASSSASDLFDAAAVILGLCGPGVSAGHGAVALERAAGTWRPSHFRGA